MKPPLPNGVCRSKAGACEAERAERRCRAVEPENRLVARTLEAEWEQRLDGLATAEAELARRAQERPGRLTEKVRERLGTLGADLQVVWHAPTTTDRDRKELLRLLGVVREQP